jgi:hypothetical protein
VNASPVVKVTLEEERLQAAVRIGRLAFDIRPCLDRQLPTAIRA